MTKTIIPVMLVAVLAQARVVNVTVTAYSSTRGQTDSSPFVAAWGDKLKPHHKYRAIAVSRDLLKRGLKRGTKAKLIVGGKTYNVIVLDKMNKRWHRRVDLYMYMDHKAVNKFGKRKGRLVW